jgi:two-component system sensor kinase FixL
MELKVREKILIITVAILLLAIGANTLVISRMFRKGYSTALQSKMGVIANTLRSQIERLIGLGITIENIEGFEAQCQEIMRKNKEVAYVMVARKNGKILFHNIPAYQGTMINDPRVKEVLTNKQQKIYLYETNGRRYYNTIVPVGDGSNGPDIAVVVGFPTTLIDSKIQEFLSYSSMVALTSLGIATFLLLTGLSISVTKPLSGLVTTIQQIRESSDLDKRVAVKSTDEIGVLADAFNNMTENLQKTTTSVDNLNREIAVRNKVEEALRKSEDRFKHVTESAGDWIWEVNAEGLYTYSSPVLEKILGYKPKEVIGKKYFYDFFAPDVKEKLKKAAFEAFTRRESFKGFINPNIHKNGSVVILETTGTPIIDDKGNLCGYRGADRDITERRNSEQRQAQLLEQLEKTNQELKDFAYVVSHDLKAPLRGINTLVKWISSDYGDKFDQGGKEQMTLLLSRVDRMHNLIDGILQYSRVGRVKEEKTQVNLNELIPSIIDTLAPSENIAITIENELPMIECERTRITQVFQNLLSNAIKYMDKPQGQIRVTCIEKDNCWKFGVADNGSGIEEKYFEKIFQMFQTLRPRDEFESTGVGLTVVKKIVEIHGGRIWVESKVGEGSTFFFTLPKKEIGIENENLEASIVG